jgi:hypothetical protein
VLGLEARIDRVARDPAGQVVLVLAAEEGRDLARFTEALAQRAWVAERLADWAQLAPERGLAPGRGARVVLVGERFDPRTRAAAASLGPEVVRLVEAGADARAPGGCARGGPGPLPGGRPDPPPSPLRSVFRTGLHPGDLAG